MTEIDESDTGPADVEISANRWCFWYFPAVFFALVGNICRAFVCFYDEIGLDFYRHALWKRSKQVDKEIVGNFREQLAEL